MTPAQAHNLFLRLRGQFEAHDPALRTLTLKLRHKHFLPHPKARDLAWYDERDGTVNLMVQALEGPAGRVEGLLAHELGHALDVDASRSYAERRADRLAKQVLGLPVRYDDEDVQNTLRGVAPRPARLPENREVKMRNPNDYTKAAYPYEVFYQRQVGKRVVTGSVPVASKAEADDCVRGMKRSPDVIEAFVRKRNPASEGFTPIGSGRRADAFVKGSVVEIGVKPVDGQYDLGKEITMLARSLAPARAKKHLPDIQRLRVDREGANNVYYYKMPYYPDVKWSDAVADQADLVRAATRRSLPDMDSRWLDYEELDDLQPSLKEALLSLQAAARQLGLVEGRRYDKAGWDPAWPNFSVSSDGQLVLRDFVACESAEKDLAVLWGNGKQTNPARGYKMPEAQARHTAEGLRQRMVEDGADTYKKKVKWVQRHIPSIDDPVSFVGWVTKGERGRVVRNPAANPARGSTPSLQKQIASLDRRIELAEEAGVAPHALIEKRDQLVARRRSRRKA